MSPSPIFIDLDIAIIGGGVAGLWLANRLSRQGFKLAVFFNRIAGWDRKEHEGRQEEGHHDF